MKKMTIQIKHCNSSCPHFYHNYEDHDHVWCGLLNEKIFENTESDLIWGDYRPREIPKKCKLEDVE